MGKVIMMVKPSLNVCQSCILCTMDHSWKQTRYDDVQLVLLITRPSAKKVGIIFFADNNSDN